METSQCMRCRCNDSLLLQEVMPRRFHICVMPCSSVSAKPVRTKAYPPNQSASCTTFSTTWKPGYLWTSASSLSLQSQLHTCHLCPQTECKRLLSLTWLQYGLNLMPTGPRRSFPGVELSFFATCQLAVLSRCPYQTMSHPQSGLTLRHPQL